MLPKDAHSAEFWSALRQAQGLQKSNGADDGTMRAASKEFLEYCDRRVKEDDLAQSIRDQYAGIMDIAVEVWGDLLLSGLRRKHVQELADKFTAGKARNFVNCFSAFSKWSRKRGRTEVNFTDSIDLPKQGKGYVPWTDEQCAIAEEKLTGMIRQGFMIYQAYRPARLRCCETRTDIRRHLRRP